MTHWDTRGLLHVSIVGVNLVKDVPICTVDTVVQHNNNYDFKVKENSNNRILLKSMFEIVCVDTMSSGSVHRVARQH